MREQTIIVSQYSRFSSNYSAFLFLTNLSAVPLLQLGSWTAAEKLCDFLAESIWSNVILLFYVPKFIRNHLLKPFMLLSASIDKQV